MSRFLWTQKEDIGRAPRQGHAMAYDRLHKRVVLFGGGTLGSDAFNDTVEFRIEGPNAFQPGSDGVYEISASLSGVTKTARLIVT